MIIYLFIHALFALLAYMRINADNTWIKERWPGSPHHTETWEIIVCIAFSYLIATAGTVIYFNDKHYKDAKFFKLIRA